MAIDREDSLRRAEKLLRQGRLDGAIQEYARLLEEQPNDWNTRNLLGDLYVRAKQIDQAAVQFTHIADHFATEGFLPRAIALYKKVVKIKPDDEHALLQSADINARQGLLVEAKNCLSTIAEQRRGRGDKHGCNEILIRIAVLDPTDLGAGMSAAHAAAEMGDTSGAAARYKALAAQLFERDRTREAIEALAEAVRLDPADESVRDSLVAAYVKGGQIEDARRHATTGAHFKAIADDLFTRGREDEGLDALFEAVQRDPADRATRARLARSLVAAGDMDRASACLVPETLGGDADLLLLAAEVHFRTGNAEVGRELLHKVIELDAARRSEVSDLGCRLVEFGRDVAYQCVDVATDAAIAVRDWAAAAGALQEFLAHAPSHIPALMKLVDVSVDGDLDDVLARAQADLAEAYLAEGRGFEARVIAEDLVTRIPGDEHHVDRFRRALVMLGEPDPEAIIADRLNPDTSLIIEDLNDQEDFNLKPAPPSAAPAPPQEAPAATQPVAAVTAKGEDTIEPKPEAASASNEAAPAVESPGAGEAFPAVGGVTRRIRPADNGRREPRGVSDTIASTVDLRAAFGGEKRVVPQPAASPEVEIDLSSVLMDLGKAQPSVEPPAPKGEVGPRPVAGHDLDDVFDELRREVVKEQATNTAAQHYKLAITYHDMGMTEECIKALEVAARSPRYRFQAASLLGRIHRHDSRNHEAIDWFERAAESPAASVDAGRSLLYELGQALEDEGEAVRALAVYLELQADAGDYRDVGARIARLSR